jgi:hypothetical protein
MMTRGSRRLRPKVFGARTLGPGDDTSLLDLKDGVEQTGKAENEGTPTITA